MPHLLLCRACIWQKDTDLKNCFKEAIHTERESWEALNEVASTAHVWKGDPQHQQEREVCDQCHLGLQCTGQRLVLEGTLPASCSATVSEAGSVNVQ